MKDLHFCLILLRVLSGSEKQVPVPLTCIPVILVPFRPIQFIVFNVKFVSIEYYKKNSQIRLLFYRATTVEGLLAVQIFKKMGKLLF